jgi:hypothetical protein
VILIIFEYINAESTGGGFPGWLQRIKGQLRTRAPDYLAATDNYMANIGAAIARAQIINGGPVILVQPENEYTGSSGSVTGGFPDPVYFAYVKKQLRDAGIVVPLISNDARKSLFSKHISDILTECRGEGVFCSWICCEWNH